MTTATAESTSALSTAVIDRGVLSGAELVARVQRVREVMKDLMEDGVHYGKVPGTQKPSLWKPGAELLLLTFRVGPRLDVEDLSNHDEIRYRVKVTGFYQPTGETLAEGIGEASTNEEKYRWRASVHEKEWAATPEDRRRVKYTKDGGEIFQIRTSPADLANTVLLMAVKRGTINMTRVVTACSDIFDQDIEDLPEELRQAGSGQTPAAAAAAAKTVQRASEQTGGAKPAANGLGGLVTDARKVKELRVFGKDKNNYALTLEGDKNEYTTKDAKLANELGDFKGTDHKIRVRYEDNEWNGKTYHNIKSFAIADADPPPATAQTTPPPATPSSQPGTPEQPTLTAGDIPFGSK